MAEKLIERDARDGADERLAAAFTAYVRSAGPSEVDALIEILDRPAARTDVADAALDDWGRLRVLTMYEQVRGDVHTVGWLEDQGVSRQRLNQWRSAGRLTGIRGIPGVRGFAYPRWQFTDTLHPQGWMPAITAAAEDARLDDLALHLFMTNPAAGDGQAPVALLDQGQVDLVVRLVRAAGAQG